MTCTQLTQMRNMSGRHVRFRCITNSNNSASIRSQDLAEAQRIELLTLTGLLRQVHRIISSSSKFCDASLLGALCSYSIIALEI